MALTRGRVALSLLVLALALLGIRYLTTTDPLERLTQTSEGLSGSIYFPRGGPYVLGFESPGEAELRIDGVVIAEGKGKVIEPSAGRARLLYEAGPHAIAFHAPPGARLLWHPPGRRGDPEYVLLSSLSPDPPGSARFAASTGAALGDAAIATSLLLLVLGALFLWAWPRIVLLPRSALWAFAGVFGLALATRLAGLSAAGQTWDEDVYWSSGKNYVINLLSFDFRTASWRWNYEHPPITKYIAGLGALWADDYGPARALFALFSAATCVLVVDLGRLWFRLRVGVFAGLACALLPHLLAHATVVGHETPSVFFWTLAVWLAIPRAGLGLPARISLVAIVVGLAVATRFANLLLGGVVGVALLCWAQRGERWRTLGLGALLAPTVALTVFFVWPRLWSHPFAHLAEAWTVLRRAHGAEPYLGQITQHPPWHYFPVYAGVTTPLLLLVLAAAGTVRAAFRRERATVVILAWLILPFGVAASPVRQDGVRYVLPFLIPLALLAALGLDLVAERLRRPVAPVALATALVVYLAITCARIYPYYLDYYGEHVGGPGEVARRRAFEIGWWGEGIQEAVAFVNARAAQGASLYRRLEPNHVNWFRADLWRNLREGSPEDAEWMVVNGLGVRPFVPTPGALLVHEVSAQGAPLVRVYRQRADTNE